MKCSMCPQAYTPPSQWTCIMRVPSKPTEPSSAGTSTTATDFTVHAGPYIAISTACAIRIDQTVACGKNM